jgi:hypothetical protein
LNGTPDDFPSWRIEDIRILDHQSSLKRLTSRIEGAAWRAIPVVKPVNRSARVAVEASAVARNRDEVRER